MIIFNQNKSIWILLLVVVSFSSIVQAQENTTFENNQDELIRPYAFLGSNQFIYSSENLVFSENDLSLSKLSKKSWAPTIGLGLLFDTDKFLLSTSLSISQIGTQYELIDLNHEFGQRTVYVSGIRNNLLISFLGNYKIYQKNDFNLGLGIGLERHLYLSQNEFSSLTTNPFDERIFDLAYQLNREINDQKWSEFKYSLGMIVRFKSWILNARHRKSISQNLQQYTIGNGTYEFVNPDRFSEWELNLGYILFK